MTHLEINKAVNGRICTAKAGTEFEPVEFVAQDVTEPIVRPSLKVELEDGTVGLLNGCCAEKTLTVRIYFFARDRYRPKAENMRMRELLEQAFLDDLVLGTESVLPEEFSSTVTDGVLVCSFDLYWTQLLPDRDNSPTMNDLYLNERVKT